ncbi:MAG: hypothetical protein AVDCRST_MAG43-38 [uncultured Thermomicrobiales bacterium]|uniref:Zinc-ribbon domain-containing protein n=1 Tax=uncultured Thermomicrobiales bacterium TaxID=1645740 RepID=A0A6J4U6S4_9BACT|nr:MAG: hypothetical protein AVDCRST_MAG43-38 [uncultured Thermomicrobiales bacterium]
MTSSSATTSRTCPVCGARNSGISLFCAECGSSLNADAHRIDDTAAIPIHPTTAQRTEPYQVTRGSTSGAQRWSTSESQDEIAPFRTTSANGKSSAPTGDRWSAASNAGGAEVFAADMPYHDAFSPTVTMVEPHASSMRGFFLGVLAFLLIAVILGLYGWTAWLSADLRDTISGWFDFIG